LLIGEAKQEDISVDTELNGIIAELNMGTQLIQNSMGIVAKTPAKDEAKSDPRDGPITTEIVKAEQSLQQIQLGSKTMLLKQEMIVTDVRVKSGNEPLVVQMVAAKPKYIEADAISDIVQDIVDQSAHIASNEVGEVTEHQLKMETDVQQPMVVLEGAGTAQKLNEEPKNDHMVDESQENEESEAENQKSEDYIVEYQESEDIVNAEDIIEEKPSVDELKTNTLTKNHQDSNELDKAPLNEISNVDSKTNQHKIGFTNDKQQESNESINHLNVNISGN